MSNFLLDFGLFDSMVFLLMFIALFIREILEISVFSTDNLSLFADNPLPTTTNAQIKSKAVG